MVRILAFVATLLAVPSLAFGQPPRSSPNAILERESTALVQTMETDSALTLPEAGGMAGRPPAAIGRERLTARLSASSQGSLSARLRSAGSYARQTPGSQAVAPITQEEFQRRFTIAQRSIDSGKKKMLYGAAIGAGSFVIGMVGGGSCSDGNCGTGAQTFGMLGLLGGMGYATLGYFQYADGKSEITLLELQRAAAARGGSFSFSHTFSW